MYVQKLSDFWRERRISLLGHILRADANFPLRQVIFENQTCVPQKPPYRRQGRPRVDWLTETVKVTFHCLGHSPPQAEKKGAAPSAYRLTQLLHCKGQMPFSELRATSYDVVFGTRTRERLLCRAPANSLLGARRKTAAACVCGLLDLLLRRWYHTCKYICDLYSRSCIHAT